jgi:hypothetical protein
MALIDETLYSQLVRRLRDFLPIGPHTTRATAKTGVLTSTKGSFVPPPAPTELPYLPKELRPTLLTARLHPRTGEIVDECHNFFLQHWPFKTETHKKRFCDEGYAWFNCILCPMGLDDRMVGVCKFLTTGFLIDDMLDRMSVEEGKAHNAVVIACCRGERLPDREKPAQWIMYDLFQEFRAIDKALADMLLKYTIDFFIAQTDADRSNIKSLQDYFEYRYADLGKGQVETSLTAVTCKLTATQIHVWSYVLLHGPSRNARRARASSASRDERYEACYARKRYCVVRERSPCRRKGSCTRSALLRCTYLHGILRSQGVKRNANHVGGSARA